MPEARTTDDPLTWLLLLERGRQSGDFDLAARARRELARMGITVTYRRRRPARRMENRHAD